MQIHTRYTRASHTHYVPSRTFHVPLPCIPTCTPYLFRGFNILAEEARKKAREKEGRSLVSTGTSTSTSTSNNGDYNDDGDDDHT